MEIEEFDDDIVEELRSRARDVLLTQAIVKEEKIDEAEPAERPAWSRGHGQGAGLPAREPGSRDA